LDEALGAATSKELIKAIRKRIRTFDTVAEKNEIVASIQKITVINVEDSDIED